MDDCFLCRDSLLRLTLAIDKCRRRLLLPGGVFDALIQIRTDLDLKSSIRPIIVRLLAAMDPVAK